MAQGISRRGFFGLLAALAGLGLARPSRAGSASATSGPQPPPAPAYRYGWAPCPWEGPPLTGTYTYDGSARLHTATDPLGCVATCTYEYVPPPG
jgi:hypothetical protein